MTYRARSKSIIVAVDWEAIQNKPPNIGADQATFENLQANGDVGSGANQVAAGNHDHEIGNMVLLFENNLI